VHDLPHAPRHQHGRDRTSATPGGTTSSTGRRSIRRRLARSPRTKRTRSSAATRRRSLKGLWSDREFLSDASQLNSKLEKTQLADFSGHGWLFRAVYKQDSKGNLLDAAARAVRADDPDRFKKAVHLKDIHLEKGMHCVDCHFQQDSHGDGRLYGEPRAAVEIDCVDCHGTIGAAGDARHERAGLARHRPLGAVDPFGQPRFTSRRGRSPSAAW
jgi:hypothetical protein